MAADAANLENLVTAFKTAASDGEDKVPVGEYVITINTTAATGSTATTLSNDASGTVAGILTSYAGENWQNTKLKSKKWTSDGSDDSSKVVTSISAKLTVGIDGSVTVNYTPATIKDQTNK